MFGRLIKFFREARARAETPQSSPERAAVRVAVVCLTAALCLTLNAYLGGASAWRAFTSLLGEGELKHWIAQPQNAQLSYLLWWAANLLVFYLLIPGLAVRLLLGEKLSGYGFRLRGLLPDAPVYGALLTLMVPVLWLCSSTTSFQLFYPFFHLPPGEPLWPRFWLWEMVYVATFFAVEFFFRGFLLLGLRDRFGYSAIFAATIPYCMVHFGKPMPEALASIAAGLLLGTFSLKSGSIVPGFLLHSGVAFGMDLAALWRKGLL